MSLSSFLIRIIFLALPGIIGTRLYHKLKGRRPQKDWEDVVEIAIFSVLSYGLYGLIVWAAHSLGWASPSFTAFEALANENVSIRWSEIAIACLIGVSISFVSALFYYQKLINRVGQAFGVSSRFGDEDVWDFFHNVQNIDWLFVRDHKLNVTYFGWIQVFSDSEKERELLLRDVRVYSNSEVEDGSATGKFLYEASVIYLSRNRYDITIEVPVVEAVTARREKRRKKEDQNGE